MTCSSLPNYLKGLMVQDVLAVTVMLKSSELWWLEWAAHIRAVSGDNGS